MIKIVKMGNKRKDSPKYEITCKHCNTVFTCSEEDLSSVLVGHGSYRDAIFCPLCHHELVLGFIFDCEMKVIS